MAHFQSFLDTPAFVPPDELSFADCELYPSEIDPYTKNRTSNLRQQLSWIEDSAKGCYFLSPYTSDAHGTNEPFSAYNADGHWSDINMNLRPAASSTAYSHSDQFPSPWTGHPSSPSGLDSPRSSSWGNIGCYMSPPYTDDDAMIPSVEDGGYPSPGPLASVALPEVKIQPDHESEVQFEPDVPAFFLDDVKEDAEQEDIGLSYQAPTVSGEPPAIDRDLVQDYRPSEPLPPRSHSKNNKPSSPYRVQKQTSESLSNRPTRTTRPKMSAPVPAQIKQRSKSKVTRGRLFVCSFAHYGCSCTFSAKNEWKRHVTSQHLQLGFYRCDLADCNIHKRSSSDHRHQHHKKSRSSSHHDHHSADLVANDFNRKDLFTQHLRRMHAPWHKENRTNPSAGERDAFERSLDEVRDRCWQPRRQPPTVSQCGFCGQDFHGEHSWDDRMEHVGRHYERDNPQPGAEAEDIKLRKWAVDEGIVQFVGGTWALTSLCEE